MESQIDCFLKLQTGCRQWTTKKTRTEEEFTSHPVWRNKFVLVEIWNIQNNHPYIE